MEYHIASKGKRLTFPDKESMLEVVNSGEIPESALYWHKGMENWAPVRSLMPRPSTPVKKSPPPTPSAPAPEPLVGAGISDAFSRAFGMYSGRLGAMFKIFFIWLAFNALCVLPLGIFAHMIYGSIIGSTHIAVGGTMENQLAIDLGGEKSDWHIGYMAAEEAQAIYELCKNGENVENWSELVTILLARTTSGIEEIQGVYERMLLESGAEVSEKEQLEDGSLVLKYESADEIGYHRIFQGPDGAYTLIYAIKPGSLDDARWTWGKSMVREASLKSKGEAAPAGGLAPTSDTAFNKTVSEAGLKVAMGSVPWPVIILLTIVIGLAMLLFSQGTMYYVALCASGEIDPGDWKVLFSGFKAWLPLLIYNLLAGIMILIGYLLFIIPGIYLTLATMYGPLRVIDRARRSFGGSVDTWDVFWSTRSGMKGHTWALFAITIIVGIASSIINNIASWGPMALSMPISVVLQYAGMFVIFSNFRAIFPGSGR